MHRTFLSLLLISLYVNGLAQQRTAGDTSLKYVQLDEVVTSANRFTEKKKNVAQKIDVISSAYIRSVNAQNTGDLLMSTGNIFVQKSQQGGSSPVLRGFEASRVLLVVDGIRMNNAIYRAGHLQNVITVDQNLLDGAEIIYGPASTLYGSDALGGVINLKTRAPKLADSSKPFDVHANAFTRFSSANNEKTLHADVNLGFRKFGFLTSVTYSYFGDMKTGSRFPGKYPQFGRRPFYVGEAGGKDSILKNTDDRIQRFSGYRQWDITQKVIFQPSANISHSLNLQFSNSTDIPRYDRLQDIRNGTLRYAKWYYGPQRRNLLAYEFNAGSLSGFFDQVRVNLNYQHIEESRNNRDYRRNDLDNRTEKIGVYGFTVDGRKTWGNNELSMGADGQLNDLNSAGRRTNIATGAVTKIDSRYPDGKNNMNNFGIFAQHTLKMMQGRLVLNDGLRLQSTSLRSTIIDTAVQLHLPYTDISQDNLAVTGNIGLVLNATNGWRVSGVLSSGFRAPNIDDLSKIFTSTREQLVVPNPDIQPEYTYNADLGISKVINNNIRIEVTGFYTLFHNAIVTAPFTYNGQDSILYQGSKSQVIANQNKNKAFLYGFNASVAADITGQLSFLSTINYTYGWYQTDKSKLTTVYRRQPDNTYKSVQANVSRKPLDHIPPVFGKTSLLYHTRKLTAEFFMLYNGWKKLDRYSPDGEDNAQYATADGAPAWTTLNLRTSFRFNPHVTLQAAVENMADRNYRYFASGFSAPGRNFIITLRGSL